MAALYDLFRTPQPKGEKKVRYHARSVVTGKMSTQDLVRAESIEFKGVVYKADNKLLKKLRSTKFLRTKYSRCSEEISEIEVDGLLMEFFKDHDCITTKEMQQLCGLSNTTALRRLQERVKEGKLTHPGHLRAPFYFPVPGNYGVSRE